MAIKSAKGKDALFTEINITPLTDIFLVLLIIMMVVAPTFQSSDNSINMPEINSGVNVEQKNATISVTQDGKMFVNGKEIVKTQLTSELLAIKDTLEKKEVVVKADEKARSSEIMEIMNSAKEAEYTKLILAGQPLSRKEQRKLESEAQSQSQIQEETVPEQAQDTGSNWVD